MPATRWPLAARFDSPCLSSMDVRPNAAGALWIMMAMKIMRPSFMSLVVADAPIAMPSAAAWITRPVVVARLFDCLGVGAKEPRNPSVSSSASPFTLAEPRLSRLMCLVAGAALIPSVACCGILSMRNMRMKPSIKESPM
ncbi:hypothetical protein SLS63_001955 [Diaporthe eres]|uniref:Uncharacterized protein n=1 Tax=Diaporthe eres TaxID=83184 RepID=A0ABR1PLP2_DIAER